MSIHPLSLLCLVLNITHKLKMTSYLAVLLRVITHSQNSIQAQLDNEETVKDFCSQNCLSSFYYKANVSTKIPIMPVGAHSQCGVCGRYCIVRDKASEYIRSDDIFNVSTFININILFTAL